MTDPPRHTSKVEADGSHMALESRGAAIDLRSDSTAETIQLTEETLQVSKREVLSGTVRVSTRTETFEEVAEVSLDHDVIDVTHVPVGKTIETAPDIRIEGDLTIVPVIEERFVVVKQLYLKEELHIRRCVETEVSRTPVSVRRQTAIVERLDGDGRALPDPAIQPD